MLPSTPFIPALISFLNWCIKAIHAAPARWWETQEILEREIAKAKAEHSGEK